MKRLVLVLAILLAFFSASVAKTEASTTAHYALVVLDFDHECRATTQPACYFFVQVANGSRGTAGVTATNGFWLNGWCGYIWPYSIWDCDAGYNTPYANASLTASDPTGAQTVKWTAWARQACPTGGGYHWSDQESFTVPAHGPVYWQAFFLDDHPGCQPTPPWG